MRSHVAVNHDSDKNRPRHPLIAALTTASSPALFLVGLAVWLAFLAWMRPLTIPDEGRYAGVAWEMLRSGSHSVPLMNGMPYFHKPPLFYWMVELSFQIFGVNEWSSRLPSLVAAWSAGAGVYFFVRRYRDATVATVASVVLVTLPLFYGAAQFANLDMLVASLISLTTMAGAAAVLNEAAGKPWRTLSLATGLLAALAMLAKGLIGLVLPGGALLIWVLWLHRWRGLRTLLWLPSILVFVVAAVPWFWLMQQKFPDFFHYFFVYQHFERFAESGFNNSQPFWFYVPIMLGLALPWTVWLGGLRHRAFWNDAATQDFRKLMAIWLLVVLVFFSMPASKLIGYILPAFPPLAVLVAEVLVAMMRRGVPIGKRYAWSLGVAVSICVTVVVVVAFSPRGGAKELAKQIVSEMRPGDQLVMVSNYPFDLAQYLQAPKPAWVVDDWNNPDIPKRDNWRKELFDAAKFDPLTGEKVLVSQATFMARACATDNARFWVWAGVEDAQRYGFLNTETPKVSNGDRAIWLLVSDAAFKAKYCGGGVAK